MHRTTWILGLCATIGCTPAESTQTCGPWFELAADGASCLERAWSTLPGPLGEPGARGVQAALDGDELGLLTWVRVASNHVDTQVMLAEEDAYDWIVRTPGRDLPGFGAQPTVATGSSGRALVTWKQQGVDRGSVFAVQRDEDGSWSRAHADRPLSFPPTAYEPRPVLTDGGESIVVWNQFGSTGFGVAVARRRASEAWDAPMHRPRDHDDVLSPPINFSNAPQIAVNAGGDAIVTWYQSNGGPLTVYASERWGHDGEFSRPGPDDYISHDVAPVDSHPIRNPTPAIRDDGEAVVVWTQEDGDGNVPVYLAARAPDGTWDVPSGPDDTFSPAIGRAACATPRYGPDGALWVVWYQDVGRGNQVFAAHRDPDGTWIEPGDQPIALSSERADALDPALATGPDGSIIAAWTERRPGEPWRIASRRRPALDGSPWGELEFLSEDDGDDALEPALAVGDHGRILAAWVQGPSQARRIRVSTLGP